MVPRLNGSLPSGPMVTWHQGPIYCRGIFTSVNDLDRKIMRYIGLYNRTATPIKWSYQDASNRIKSASEINETEH